MLVRNLLFKNQIEMKNILIFIGSLFLVACASFGTSNKLSHDEIAEIQRSQPPIVKTTPSSCHSGGGVWSWFSNGCVDRCSDRRDERAMCTHAETFGCDCGSDQCWNGSFCEDN